MSDKETIVKLFKEEKYYRLLSEESFDMDDFVRGKAEYEENPASTSWVVSDYLYSKEQADKMMELGIKNVKLVQQWGGEGEGNSIGTVFYFEDFDLYLKLEGYYQSHHGAEWYDSPTEVRPKEKTIIVYE